MMLIGFADLGFAFRRSRRNVSVGLNYETHEKQERPPLWRSFFFAQPPSSRMVAPAVEERVTRDFALEELLRVRHAQQR